MYEFKDSENIKITNSTTTSEKLIKSDNSRNISADNCHAGVVTDENIHTPEQPIQTKVREWIAENMIVSIFSIIAVVITTITLSYLGLAN